jgi:hypothetical protein
MNPPPDHERLLADVLAEAAPAGFRATLLGRTLRLARRRRRLRKARHAAAAIALASLLGILAWRGATARTPVASYELVRTQPLPAHAIMSSQRLPADRLIASGSNVNVVRTTTNDDRLRIVDDAGLLALVSPWPAALVRLGPHRQELVFVNPADARGFPVQ